ncbi:hypothetical protein MY11210_006195 [Beauveria gryllotalpidicola]
MASFPVANGVTVLMAPPDGVTPDFDNPRQNRALAAALPAFMFLGWIMPVATQAILTYSIAQGGMCAHAWEMPLERFERYSTFVYVAAPVSLRSAVSASRRGRASSSWALYTVAIAVIMLFHCSPVCKAFDLRMQTGACLDTGILYMSTAVSNILSDVMLFLLPTPIVLHLEMDRAQKMGAIANFGIASATVATSIEHRSVVGCRNSPVASKNSAQSTLVTWGVGRARRHRRWSQFEDASEMKLVQRGGACEDKTAEHSVEAVNRPGADVEQGLKRPQDNRRPTSAEET